MIKLILIRLSVKERDIRDFIKQLKRQKRWMFLAMDKKKFRIIQDLLKNEQNPKIKKLIELLIYDVKQLNKSKDIG